MMISTAKICEWLEEIERQKIPPPTWIPDKQVFEYGEVTVEVVAFLKAVRATQSLHSLPLLAEKGLTFDFGTIVRSIIECTQDISFLLEKNPENEKRVAEYIEHFRSTTIDKARESSHQPVDRNKIQNSAARALLSLVSGCSGRFGELERQMKELSSSIWNAWCDVTHSNYASIMEIYGPLGSNPIFQLRGIPSTAVVRISGMRECGEQINLEVAISLWYMTMSFGLDDLAEQIGREIEKDPE